MRGLAFGSGPFAVGSPPLNILRMHYKTGSLAKPTTHRRNPMRDCGACCNTCGHDDNCQSLTAPVSDPSDDYTA